MQITITDVTPIEGLEIVRQLFSTNAGLMVDSVRRQPNSDKYKIVVGGDPDFIGVTEDIGSDEEALAALRTENLY